MVTNLPKGLIEFADRDAVIATRHRKELAIAPILETGLGLRITVPQILIVTYLAHLLEISIALQIKFKRLNLKQRELWS